MIDFMKSFNEYQEFCKRTDVDFDNLEALKCYTMGLMGESGEVMDYLKKVIWHGVGLDKHKLSLELGDVLWYLAMLASRSGISLSTVVEDNVAKLRKRYPNGFSHQGSKKRIDTESEEKKS